VELAEAHRMRAISSENGDQSREKDLQVSEIYFSADVETDGPIPGRPILVAYPVSFDWTWLYWYFTAFCESPSPFGHSNCFDVKTALAVKNNGSVASSSRSKLPIHLRSNRPHTHFAVDDAIEQAEVFANIFEWQGCFERTRKKA